MNSPMNPQAVLDRHYLEMRARVLELGAAFDRIQRAGDIPADDRLLKLHKALSVVMDANPDRAVRIQMIFSDPYDPNWPRPSGGTGGV